MKEWLKKLKAEDIILWVCILLMGTFVLVVLLAMMKAALTYLKYGYIFECIC